MRPSCSRMSFRVAFAAVIENCERHPRRSIVRVQAIARPIRREMIL